MHILRRILLTLAIAAAPAAHAGMVIAVSGGSGWWLALLVVLGLEQRPVPQVSPHHITATVPAPAPAKDTCVFVAGVRHCPRAEPR